MYNVCIQLTLNMYLNFMGPLTRGFFSIDCSSFDSHSSNPSCSRVSHVVGNPHVRTVVTHRFSTAREISALNPSVVQESTVRKSYNMEVHNAMAGTTLSKYPFASCFTFQNNILLLFTQKMIP